MRVYATRGLALGLTALLCASCALTSKDESVFFRYFTPERPLVQRAAYKADGQQRDLRLRLGRVNSASYLKDRIAFRDSDNEIRFYEQLLWSEKPEAYVRRATSRVLFDEFHVRQVVAGPGMTLDVDLNAFEELRGSPHAAHVELSWLLRDDQVVIVQRTVGMQRPIPAAKTEAQGGAVATAMGDALDEAIHAMVTDVVASLASTRPAMTGQ